MWCFSQPSVISFAIAQRVPIRMPTATRELEGVPGPPRAWPLTVRDRKGGRLLGDPAFALRLSALHGRTSGKRMILLQPNLAQPRLNHRELERWREGGKEGERKKIGLRFNLGEHTRNAKTHTRTKPSPTQPRLNHHFKSAGEREEGKATPRLLFFQRTGAHTSPNL